MKIPYMNKTQEEYYKRDGYPRIPSTSRYIRIFNHCEGKKNRRSTKE